MTSEKAEYIVSLPVSAIITEEYNVIVNSGALTGYRISDDAIEEMSQNPKLFQSDSTNILCIIQVRVCKEVTGVSSATRQYRQIISKLCM